MRRQRREPAYTRTANCKLYNVYGINRTVGRAINFTVWHCAFASISRFATSIRFAHKKSHRIGRASVVFGGFCCRFRRSFCRSTSRRWRTKFDFFPLADSAANDANGKRVKNTCEHNRDAMNSVMRSGVGRESV